MKKTTTMVRLPNFTFKPVENIDLSAAIARLNPTDTDRLDWLDNYLKGWKWDDWMPEFRPKNEDGECIEKYIGDGITIREAIDAAMKRTD